MDRNQAKEFYPILQAFAEGKVIETRTDPNVVGKGLEDLNDWTEMKEIEYWNNVEYRVKSEPTYRPFKDGDIVAVDLDRKNIRIFKEKKNENNICFGKYYIGFSFNNEGKLIQTFKNYTADCSSDRLATEEEKQQLFDALAKEGKAWDAEKKEVVGLKPKVEFKPFDKVLVRDNEDDIWEVSLFGYKDELYYRCDNGIPWIQCIPYDGNEHLLGTTNNVEG